MNFNMGGMNMYMMGAGAPHSPHQSMDFAEEQYIRSKTSVWWDIENCPVPKSCEAHTIAQNISAALFRLNYCGPLSVSAYGDTTMISPVIQRALNSTGISLNHVPNGAKDASDKKILVDMLFWAVDNPAPANFLLISGDRDFSNALHQLRMRRYNILLAQPQKASATLIAAAKTVWLWTNLSSGGPPGSSVDSPPIGYNGYGFASGSAPTQPSDSFHQKVHVGKQSFYKFRCKHGNPARQSGVCLLKCHKYNTRAAKKNNQLAPKRNLGKKPITPNTPQPPVCNNCQRPHFGPCRNEKGICFKCHNPGHYVRDCPVEGQGQNKTPGPAVAAIRGGKKQNMTSKPVLPVNQAGDEEQNMTPAPLLAMAQVVDGEQYISLEPVSSLTQVGDGADVMTPEPILAMTRAGDDQDITPVPKLSMGQADDEGQNMTPESMDSVIKAGYKFVKLSRYLTAGAREEEFLMEQFELGLPTSLQTAFSGHTHSSVQEMYELAANICRVSNRIRIERSSQDKAGEEHLRKKQKGIVIKDAQPLQAVRPRGRKDRPNSSQNQSKGEGKMAQTEKSRAGCWKCGQEGHLRSHCPNPPQQNSRQPQLQNAPPQNVQQNKGKHISPELVSSLTQVGDGADVMTPEPILAMNWAGDDQDITPVPKFSMGQADDEGQNMTPEYMDSVIKAGNNGHNMAPQPMFTCVIPEPVPASDKADPANSTDEGAVVL